jgi:hypothetical protein
MAAPLQNQHSALSRPGSPAAPRTPSTTLPTVCMTPSDRAKRFYQSLGWRVDADFATGDDFRVVQLTGPGSPCSIIFGIGITTSSADPVEGLQLTVADVEAARAELVAAGVEVSEVSMTSAVYFTTGVLRVGSAVQIQSVAATPRSPRSPTPMATAGGCKRSRPGTRPARATPRQRHGRDPAR